MSLNKALFTSTSANVKTIATVVISLISLVSVIYPEISLAAQVGAQTSGQNQALVFEIKPTPKDNTQTKLLSYRETVTSNPLYQPLQKYLKDKNSPLASDENVTILMSQPEYKRILAISYIESHMCQYQLHNNCSGIMTSKGIKPYANFGEWVVDMNKLLSTRYAGKSFEKMNCVYVQPCSPNWVYASNKIYGELNAIEAHIQTASMQAASADIALK